MVGVRPGGAFCPRGDAGGRVVSDKRKASRAASLPMMVRICVGLCGESLNRTLYMVIGGRHSKALGLPLGRLFAVAACMRGMGILASMLVIVVMTKPCACRGCAS